jgi:hypothetical protein
MFGLFKNVFISGYVAQNVTQWGWPQRGLFKLLVKKNTQAVYVQ